jgi:hypothetical protein
MLNGIVLGTLTLGLDGSALFTLPGFTASFRGDERGSQECSRFLKNNNAVMLDVVSEDTMQVKLTPPVYVHRFQKPRR